MTKKTKTTKTIKKSKNPEFIVNAYTPNTVNDLNDNVVYAKIRAGMLITEDEIDSVITNFARKAARFMALMTSCLFEATQCDMCPKKEPWYKRLWKWIRRK